jgi:phospholipid/cholesterol/gamma-HCH transport system substrate-binding protein
VKRITIKPIAIKRLNFRRITIKPIRERNPIVVAVAGLALLAVVCSLVYFSNDLPFIGGTGYTAYFSEAAGLQPGNEVRIAGVTVGQVTGVSLAGDKVAVTFDVKNAWVGNQTTAAIEIKTLLGDKYLAIDPLGNAPQNPGQPIPLSRTTSPYDVTQAFSGLAQQVSQINTAQLARSLQTLSDAFATTPPYVRQALSGLASLSASVASKDAEITSLLAGAKTVTGTLASEDSRFASLLSDGNLLLAELRERQDAISAMLTDTRELAVQVSGLVYDDQAQLAPALQALNQVTNVLQANQANLAKALALAGPYYRTLNDALGQGRWFDVYLCGLIPRSYIPDNTPSTGCQPPEPVSRGAGS